MKTVLTLATRPTPVGDVRFAVTESGALVALDFADRWDKRSRWLDCHCDSPTFVASRITAPVGHALDAYLAGEVAAVDGLWVELRGTDFQRRVWAALRVIRAGTTCSYADIARAIGAPRAVRAVGAANGANPVAIVVPCHRVIGSDGTLTGYAGGVERKAWLLAHETGTPLPASPRAAAVRTREAATMPLF